MAEKLITEDLEKETVVFSKKAAEILFWKLSMLDSHNKLHSYSFYGPGWDGQDAKPISKKALLRAFHYLEEIAYPKEIPASVPIKNGSIWFEDEKGEVHAICTENGVLIRDRKEIDKYLGKVYGK